MNLSSTFKTEVYRPVVTVIIPGALSIAPYLFILSKKFDIIAQLIKKYPSGFCLLFMLCSIAAGFILENFGAKIEARIWDKIQPNSDEMEKEWYDYLRLAFNPEPIGHRYLRTITLRLKFELSFSLSLLFFIIGFLICSIKWNWFSACWNTIFTVATIGLSLYCLYESYSSSKLLRKLRHELLEGINLQPKI